MMPSLNFPTIFRRKFLNQIVVYWAKAGQSDGYGKPSYADPVELKARVEDTEIEILMADGRKVMAGGYVFLVDEVEVGGLLFDGTLGTWQALPNYPDIPSMNQGAKEIMKVDAIPGPTKRTGGTVYEAYYK